MVTIEKNSTEHIFSDVKLKNMAFEKFYQMRQSQEMCDVTLISSDDVSEHCHRLVLSGCSPYFHAMFKTYKEKYQKDIKLKSINSKILSLIVKYIYTSDIIITQDTVQDLLSASSMLELLNLHQACIDFLKRQLDVDNCLGIDAIADLYSCSELLSHTQRFIEDHFTNIVSSNEFLNLPVERLKTFLTNDHLNIETEEIVFESVLNWLSYDLVNRDKYFLDLVKYIRVKLLQPEYLLQKFTNNPFLKRQLEENYSLFFNLFQARYDVLNDSNEICFCTISTPRQAKGSSHVMLVIGGRCIDNKLVRVVEFYDFGKNQWSQLVSDVPSSTDIFGASVLNGKLYVASSKTVEVYNSEFNKWSHSPPMLQERFAFGFVSMNNSLYAIGGKDIGSKYLNTCEKFNFFNKKWSYLPHLLWKVECLGSQILNNVLYVVGGRNGTGILNSAQAFDFRTKKWSQLPDMIYKRASPATCVLNGKLYVCGGLSDIYLNSVECYDPQSNSWIEVACMNTERCKGSAVTYKGLIYVSGGYNPNRLSSIEIYDPAQNVWSVSPINKTSEHSCHSSVVMDKSTLKSIFKYQFNLNKFDN